MVNTLLSMQGAQVQSLVEGLRSCMHSQNKVSSHWGKTSIPPFLKMFLAVLGLHQCGGFSVVAESRGFSLCWLLLLQSMGSTAQASVVTVLGLSRCLSLALEHRFNSCGTRV